MYLLQIFKPWHVSWLYVLQVKNLDQYGRNVAACSISPDLPFQQPEDMGTFLVSNGYAVAYRCAVSRQEIQQMLRGRQVCI